MIFLSTLPLIPLFCRVAVRVNALDVPDARKVHTAPVPRCGGVAMALGAVVPIVFWAQMSPQLSAYLAGCTILFAAEGCYKNVLSVQPRRQLDRYVK
jgi:UDP-GlcNAc:undecaprenyl-phosphate/decaprenyl-phosphate GlcNAc-1-phosphate transferase